MKPKARLIYAFFKAKQSNMDEDEKMRYFKKMSRLPESKINQIIDEINGKKQNQKLQSNHEGRSAFDME